MTRNNTKNKNLREFNYFAKNFKLELGKKRTVVLDFDIRMLEIKISKTLMYLDFVYSILLAFEQSSILASNRFGSFCKETEGNDVKYYINGFGDNYFADLLTFLMGARKEVFINDWFLSPQIYLRRPVEDNLHTRLDLVLTHLAKRGVKIYVIIYREIEETLANASAFTKRYLNKCHKNINVVRHPRFFIHYWSHHEKMCIIDSTVVFMGGIDLCFGRFEMEGYPLFEPVEGKTYFLGQDYSNPRIYDFEEVNKWRKCLIDKATQPRMPWRDIALRAQGEIVRAMKKHFLQYWNFNNIQFSYKNTIEKDNTLNAPKKSFGKSLSLGAQEQRDTVGPGSASIDAGKLSEAANVRAQLIEPESPLVAPAKTFTPREIGAELQTEYSFSEEENEETFESNMIGLINTNQPEAAVSGNFYCQGLRSGSSWSIGLPLENHEHSIQNAYIQLIRSAEHFVYIENQFFISSTAGSIVENQVIACLADRIIRSIYEKKPFVVYILIPLLPGFGGNITENDGDLLRIQVKWHLETIIRGQNSLINRVKIADQNWEKYIKIFGLRNNAVINGDTPISEIVYVHSKLMIVDDRVTLIGSANINDRSLCGDRDSELAMVCEEKEKVSGKLAGKEYQKSGRIREFRINAFRSIFGIDADYEDPLDGGFIEAVERQTLINDEFYFNVFKFYPHNNYSCFEDVRAKDKTVDKEYFFANLHKVKGYALPYPVHFLEKESKVDFVTSLAGRMMDMRIFT